MRLLSITKLQNLKAIHNSSAYFNKEKQDVINHKTTKFESNSQRQRAALTKDSRCYQSQNYKIWKQFTTPTSTVTKMVKMLSITKLQNLKAIHNKVRLLTSLLLDVINHKTTKFESNSQRAFIVVKSLEWCYQSQNYKIWKQFTTISSSMPARLLMLSITKLQNLKAIHNILAQRLQRWNDVINHKTTKFESNSQRTYFSERFLNGCYQS